MAIWSYIAPQNEAAADALLARFDEKLALLTEFPRMGTPRPHFRPEARSITVGNYILLYRPIRDGIRLLRVFDARRGTPPAG